REQASQAGERVVEARRGERRRLAVEEEVERHLGALGERSGERGRGGEPAREQALDRVEERDRAIEVDVLGEIAGEPEEVPQRPGREAGHLEPVEGGEGRGGERVGAGGQTDLEIAGALD